MGLSGCCCLVKYLLILINFAFWVSDIQQNSNIFPKRVFCRPIRMAQIKWPNWIPLLIVSFVSNTTSAVTCSQSWAPSQNQWIINVIMLYFVRKSRSPPKMQYIDYCLSSFFLRKVHFRLSISAQSSLKRAQPSLEPLKSVSIRAWMIVELPKSANKLGEKICRALVISM